MLAALILLAASLSPLQAKIAPLESLDLNKMTCGWGRPRIGRSIEDKPLTAGGKVYEAGVGTHAASKMRVSLDAKVLRFSCLLAVDDETKGRGSVQLRIYGDGKKLHDSGIIKGNQAPKPVDVTLRGVKALILSVSGTSDGIDYDHADLLNAEFQYEGAKPVAVSEPVEKEYLLTPPAPKAPRLNTTPVIGCTPGKPFLYRIPATGVRPMRFEAKGLPASLKLDPRSGILSGTTPTKKGTYKMAFRAKNAKGSDEKALELRVGNTLALTPPMGWNSWYIHYSRVSDVDMRKAADVMVSSGMADYGYQFVNIDDCWARTQRETPLRAENGTMLTSSTFPDMPALTRYIHAKGLLAGIYTSPGPWTCAGYTGAYEHEAQDAQTFADWGFDFLKYDWCSYENVATGTGIERLKKPYAQMGEILKGLNRDMVYNLCQYGMGDVWNWGASVNGNCWRTTGDLGNMSSWRDVGLANMKLWKHAKPGFWNDPDYILIGWIGDSSPLGRHKVSLPPSEQYSYMAMWCLMASPLIFSGDMARLDRFTVNVLCNAEVIAVDQDILGKQARVVRDADDQVLLAKSLADGSLAVGLFNFSEVERTVGFTWKEIGLSASKAPRRVRDLWRQKDVRADRLGLSQKLPVGGCVMVRVWPRK